MFGGAAHFEKDQSQFGSFASQGSQHRFFANCGQDDVAIIASDVDLFEVAAPQFSSDALTQAEHGSRHG